MAMRNPCTEGRLVDAAVVVRDLPLRRPLRGARGPVTARRERLLVLTADDGVRGAGDASRVDWLRASSPEDDAALENIVKRIRGDAPPAAALLQWSLDPAQPSALRSAVQTALLDADARRRGQGLAALLSAGVAGTRAPLSALVGDGAPDEMAREAAGLREGGLSTFKVKVGRASLDDDVAAVAAVRGAAGPVAQLRLDANGAWDLEAAVSALRELAVFAPAFVEEPLRDASRCAELASRLSSPVAVALDESLRDGAALDAAVARGGFHAVVLKLERTGGPLPALAMAARAARAGLDVVFTDSIDGRTGRAATLHCALAAAARSGRSVAAVGLGGLFLLDDGDAPSPFVDVDAPGLGVEVPAGRAAR